jgi:hypothetical protein
VGKCTYFVYAEDSYIHQKNQFPLIAMNLYFEILLYWRLGKGKDYIAVGTWNKHMTSNTLFKNHIIKTALQTASDGEQNFSFTTLDKNDDSHYFNLVETIYKDNGNYVSGGYFSADDLMNGTNNDYGGFYYSGSIKPFSSELFIVSGEYSFNDFMDPNFDYKNDIVYSEMFDGTPFRLSINGEFLYLMSRDGSRVVSMYGY